MLRRWLKSIIVELHARGVNQSQRRRVKELSIQIDEMAAQADKITAENMKLAMAKKELQKKCLVQDQKLFTQDFTIMALRAEVARLNQALKQKEQAHV